MMGVKNHNVHPYTVYLLARVSKVVANHNKLLMKIYILEIKPYRLGFIIRDMEAEWRLKVITDLIYW